MSRLPLLVDPTTLHERLGDDGLRIFDATITLDRPTGGGPYAIRDERAADRAPIREDAKAAFDRGARKATAGIVRLTQPGDRRAAAAKRSK